MKFYLMWANHDATYGWDKRNSHIPEVIWLGSQPREEFDRVCDRVIEKYFSQPNYYKINGCPVFMIYDVCNLIRGLGGIPETRQALEDFRSKVAAAGFPGLHLQLTIWSENTVDLSGVDRGRTGSTITSSFILWTVSVLILKFWRMCRGSGIGLTGITTSPISPMFPSAGTAIRGSR